MEQRLTIADGTLFRWLEHGSGRPVILVHGIPTSPELWRDVMRSLPEVRTHAWELVGFGASWRQGLGGDISVRAQADHLRRWMDAVGVERAVLVGHDLGGGVVQNMAVRFPERCTGMVLTDCISHDSWPIGPVKAIRGARRVIQRMPPGLLRPGFEAFMRVAHDSPAAAADAMHHHWSNYDHSEGARALVRQALSLRTEDTSDIAPMLAGVSMPAHVVWAGSDRFLPFSYGERLARDLDAPLDRIEGGRHYTPEDHPERVAAAIRGVLRRVDAGEQRRIAG